MTCLMAMMVMMMKEPQSCFDELETKYKYKHMYKYEYKLKGVGEPAYHLGGNFSRDPDGTLAWGAKSYIKRMLDNYKQVMFGDLPKLCSSPLVTGDSLPELDTSTELGPEDMKKYQSVIGALQWCVTLGRFDIACALMHSHNLMQVQGVSQSGTHGKSPAHMLWLPQEDG